MTLTEVKVWKADGVTLGGSLEKHEERAWRVLGAGLCCPGVTWVGTPDLSVLRGVCDTGCSLWQGGDAG